MTAPTPDDAERAYILAALERCAGSTHAAALDLRWALRTLQRRIAELWSDRERRDMQKRGLLPVRTKAATAARRERARGRRMARAVAE